MKQETSVEEMKRQLRLRIDFLELVLEGPKKNRLSTTRFGIHPGSYEPIGRPSGRRELPSPDVRWDVCLLNEEFMEWHPATPVTTARFDETHRLVPSTMRTYTQSSPPLTNFPPYTDSAHNTFGLRDPVDLVHMREPDVGIVCLGFHLMV